MASVVSIEGILFLKEKTCERFYSKYFSKEFQDMKQSETLTYEKELFAHFLSTLQEMKSNSDPDILSFKNHQVMVQKFVDFYVFILSNENENELVVLDLMNCLSDCLQDLIKGTKAPLSMKTLSSKDRFMRFLTIIDEMIYEGAIVTLEPNQIINTVNMDMRGGMKVSPPKKNTSSTASAFSQVFGLAKKSLKKTLKFPS